MTTWFVSRHAGATEWARRNGHGDATVVAHLDPEAIADGDLVLGTLPIHIAATVCARGAEFHHLAMDLPRSARERDLSADEMERFGARLERYHVERLPDPPTPE